MPDAPITVFEECTRCGASVELDDAFCRQCGGDLGADPRGRAWGVGLSWLFYPVLVLCTAAAVYAFLEARRPASRAYGQRAVDPARPAPKAGGEGGPSRDFAVATPAPQPRAAVTSPRRDGLGVVTSKRRTIGASSASPGRDARPSAKARVDSGLSAREAARARANASAIGYVVNHHRARLRRCLERLTKKGLEPSGLVEIHLSVGPQGRALHAKVHGNTTGYPTLGRCIANEMGRWRYPRPAGGRAELIYPFRFSSGK